MLVRYQVSRRNHQGEIVALWENVAKRPLIQWTQTGAAVWGDRVWGDRVGGRFKLFFGITVN